MSLEKETALLEAILFLENEPVNLTYLSRVAGLEKGVLKQVMDRLAQDLAGENRGLGLAEIDGGYLLVPKEEFTEVLKANYGQKNEEKLSRAALETLSIIAYSQPLTRSEVENIRGVSVDGMMRLLLKKKLIKEVGKKDVPGKPLLYGTTRDFLRLFRLKSIADLPKLDDVEADRFELNG
ncbi:MAG: SMC-Scp complex subunit ScpB [Spirochaetales bacterium]|nr:SMC-Scp complex subunit ScpB [Spirochaetales bacterium]